MKEIRIVLTENMFTNICKNGFMRYGSSDISFSKNDIKVLTLGEILDKELDDSLFRFILEDIGMETIIEILKRSPIYSDMTYNINFQKK